jgi:hypothetical protein
MAGTRSIAKLAETVGDSKHWPHFGKDRSTLCLGPAASEQQFAGDNLLGYSTITFAFRLSARRDPQHSRARAHARARSRTWIGSMAC